MDINDVDDKTQMMSTDSPGSAEKVSRRSLLQTTAAGTLAGITGLAGCQGGTGGSQSNVEPISQDSLTIWHAMGGVTERHYKHSLTNSSLKPASV